ncbi:MAG: ATP-binding protein [Lachnospiraceae bacterium]|nr:ATP-binding protein [Lachnospiraceae bacterium]
MEKANKDTQINRLILKTLIPNFTSELSLSSTSIVDGIICGMFYGKGGLAAVGMGAPILSVFTIAAGILGTGNSVICSRLIGKSSREESNRCYSLAILWSVFWSVLLSVFCIGGAGMIAGWFCGSSNPEVMYSVASYIFGFSFSAAFIIFRQLLIPMINMEGGNHYIHISGVVILVSDGVADYISCAVFNAGTFGLGFASALSYVAGCAVLLLFYLQKKGTVRLDFRNCFSWNRTKEIYRVGLPTAVKRLCNVLAPVFCNRFVLAITAVNGAAALSVQTSSTRFALCLVLALSTSFLVLSGNLFAECDRTEMEDAAKAMIFHSLAWSIGLSIIFLVFTDPIVSLFVKNDPEVKKMAIYAVRWFIIGIPFMAINHTAASWFQATGHLSMSNAVIIADRLISTVVLVYLLGWMLGGRGVFIAYGASEIFVTVFIYLMLCIKNRRIITNISQMLMLGDDYGIPAENRLSKEFHMGDNVVGFSEQVQNFCLEHGANSKTSFFAALCAEEWIVNTLSHGFKNKRQLLGVRIFVDPGKNITMRLRDDGVPFNLKERWDMIEKSEHDPSANIGIRIVHGLAKELSYNAAFGMNNTMIRL